MPMRHLYPQLVFALLALYAFLAPLGNLARFGSEEGAYGMTSVLLVLIVAATFPTAVLQVRRNALLFSLALLIGWMIGASTYAEDAAAAYLNSLSLLLYLLLAATAYRFVRGERRVVSLIQVYCLGGLVSATATLVDFAGLVDIPGVNELRLSTETGLGYVTQASGAFARRSAMGAYYTLIITLGFLLPVLRPQLPVGRRLLLYAAAAGCLLALLLTHTRAAIIGAALAIAVVLVSTARSPLRLLRRGGMAAAFAALVALAVVHWFPDVRVAYEALLRIDAAAGSGEFYSESDALRLVLFKHALAALAQNPLGHGYSALTGVPGFARVDPHNIITQAIWGAGLFGLVWTVVFGTRFAARSRLLLRRRRSTASWISLGLVLFGALLAFALNNMMHNSLSTGVAWVFLGVYLHVVKGG